MYETLDTIADAYNPFLFIIALIQSIAWMIQGEWYVWIKLLISAGIVYGVKYLDTVFKLWESFHLDYSTHTAVAVSLALYLVHKNTHRKIYAATLYSSLLGYILLMLYQRYHTVQDIMSTACFIIICLIFVYKRSLKRDDEYRLMP